MSKVTVRLPPVFAPFKERSRYKAAWGGRGSGKSHTFASLLVLRAAAQRGCRIVCVRQVQKSLDESVKFLIEQKIREHRLPGFRSYYSHISTPGGGKILFEGMQGATADSIKSLEGADIAWVEEAQTLSTRSLELLTPTIRKPQSEIWFSWNPRFKTDPVDNMFRSDFGAPPKSIVLKVNYTENPFFPEVLKDDMEWDRHRDPDKYAHVWLGAYEQRSEARVFHNWTIEPFLTPGESLEAKDQPLPRFYFGADWGFSVDPTVLVRMWIGRDGRLYIDQEVRQVGCTIEKTPDLFKKVPLSQDWPIIADSARPETIDYMQRHGFPKMKPSRKGTGSVEEGIEFLKNFDIVIHPRCKHTADEFTHYSYKTDKQTNEVLPILEDKKNHVIDSVRYGVETLRRANASAVKTGFRR